MLQKQGTVTVLILSLGQDEAYTFLVLCWLLLSPEERQVDIEEGGIIASLQVLQENPC